VIPVKQRLAPKGFNEAVLRPGRQWLKENHLPAFGPIPAGTELKPFWRTCLADLHKRYGGICAYVSIYIDPVTGARSVDHFIAKSSAIQYAYRWSNYRLACQKMNARKGTFDTVLDPFEIREGTFVLNLLDGGLMPNPTLDPDLYSKARTTIDVLGLDEEDCRTVRRDSFTDYVAGEISADYLRRRYPFVWYEVNRQKAVR
jgi:hypothetical protein